MRKQKLKNTVYVMLLILFLFSPLTSPIFHIAEASFQSDSQHGRIQTVARLEGFVKPIIRHVDAIDRDSDGIQDSLENMILQTQANKSSVFPVVVTLYNPPTNQDLDWFEMLGGRVTHVYHYVTYGFAGIIPAVNLLSFAAFERDNLNIIEYDAPLRYHLDVSVPLIRARPIVWSTYGYTGSPDQSIAILDTGIDDSHPDVGPFGNLNFSRKLVGWYDATSDGATTPQDYGEHGTHVAGIAAGTGSANALQGSGSIKTTFTYVLPSVNWGYADYFDVLNPGMIALSATWGGGNTVGLRLDNPAGATVTQTSGKTQPLTLTYNTVGTSYPTGRYRVVVFNLGGASGTPFACVETYPYQGLSDGYNLFTGVAPNSKLVGVKVFNNAGSGTTSTLTAGMDWVVQNRLAYNITVVNLSVGLEYGATDTTLDQKADTLVNNGVVTVVSAGNDFPDYTIGSPGTAAYVITVAATNDQNGLTSYSSNGDSAKNEYGLIKPDVSAPGGTFQTALGNQIISVDSNDVDDSYSGFPDQNSNDYQQMAGTSMSAPHVAGLASLVIEALGSWGWTLEEALKVKMLISMTSFEVQKGEDTNVPPLNRGGKDAKEGYGRVSADAAIEAAKFNYNLGESVACTLGSAPSDKKVWARPVLLSGGTDYEFHLSVPLDADYDLYLYNGSSDSYGQPLILEKSVNASAGAKEVIYYRPANSGRYYLLVKWVNGNGAFTLQSYVAPTHDVGVISVAPSSTRVYRSLTLNISVTVKNLGTVPETFNVTAYYNGSSIETMTVSDLAPSLNVSLIFSWKTDGTPIGNYVISAVADPVARESDLTNNSLEDGAVYVKTPGDINGDNRVNVFDAILMTINYGCAASDFPDGDINQDCYVNVLDAILIMANWTG